MGPQASPGVRLRGAFAEGKDVERAGKFALGPGALSVDRREFAEPGSGFHTNFRPLDSPLFPPETAP